MSCIAGALLNGSIGMSMLHKTVLICMLLVDSLVVIAVCGRATLGVALCQTGVVVVGATVSHLAELYLRRVYVEKVRLDEDKRKLEERNEQLKAEKERLQYDLQRGQGHALDDDGYSAIRRGLQAGRSHAGGRSQASHPAHDAHRSVSEAGRSVSKAGGPPPSDAPPPSLPPGAPSSASSGSSLIESATKSDSRWLIPSLTWAEADRQLYAEKAARLEADRQFYAEKAREAARLEADRQFYPEKAARLASKPAKRRKPGDGRAAAAHSQPSQKGATPPISWSETDRGDLRQFPVFVEMATKRSGSEEAAALCSIAASLCGHAPPPLTEQRAAPLSSTEAGRKPHTDRAGVGCSGPALTAPGALTPAEPSVSELLFPTAERVLAEVLATEEAELAAMTEMAELVDDEVVESIADQMAEMVDDEVVDALAQHMVHNLG